MSKKYNLAIVGATGLVGTTALEILEAENLPIENLYLLASSKSVGEVLEFKRSSLPVSDLAEFDFKNADIAIFSAGSAVAKKYAPIAAKNNCVVIDNSSAFRYDEDVPLVVSEVNAEILNKSKSKIIGNPNCTTMQLVVAPKPIYDAVGIDRINVATYQAVAGAGKKGIDELSEQTREVLSGRPVEKKIFPHQIAFNVIPHIDVMEDNGYSREEMKIVWETQKILNDNKIKVNPTAVRVPVFFGHAIAAHIETSKKITRKEALKAFSNAPGIIVIDEPNKAKYPLPFPHAIEYQEVLVGRVREDISSEKGLNIWIVADNVKKGAALNAVQITKYVIENNLI